MTNEAWKEIVADTGLNYTQRSISHALVLLCVYHEERTPSLFLYPSGNLQCHGCGQTGTINSEAGIFDVIKKIKQGVYTPKYDWVPQEFRYQQYIADNGFPPADSQPEPAEEANVRFDPDTHIVPEDIAAAPWNDIEPHIMDQL